jgi:predicted nucleic acid-binding protein
VSQKPLTKKRKRNNTPKEGPKEPVLRSDMLPILGRAVEADAQLKKLLGTIPQFQIVVDANVLLGQIKWATQRKDAAAKTSLCECILAGTIVAYVTPTIVSEVDEHLFDVAIKYKLSPKVCRSEWTILKQLLRVKEPDHAIVEKYINGQDPDDAPTLALADMLAASGILSRDSDIRAMGGNCIPDEFVVQARDYSRKATISISIEMGGYYVVIGAAQALPVLLGALKRSVTWTRSLPDNLKLIALTVLIFVVVHPRTRNSIVEFLEGMGRRLPDALQIILYLADMAANNQAVPPTLPVADQR